MEFTVLGSRLLGGRLRSIQHGGGIAARIANDDEPVILVFLRFVGVQVGAAVDFIFLAKVRPRKQEKVFADGQPHTDTHKQTHAHTHTHTHT